MKIKFTKMHGAGNDFVVIDGINQHINLSAEQLRFIADRKFGIGADQILIVTTSTTPNVDFRYQIFNADGSEVEQCGNGARAFVKFVTDKKLTNKQTIQVETLSGIIILMLEEDGRITVNMGAPILEPKRIPFNADNLSGQVEGKGTIWPLDIDDTTIWISAISMGNPHAVQIVDNTNNAPVAQQGPLIEHHSRFPQRVNAGFMQIIDRHNIALRVFERGSGETLSCGTGACAAVVAGILRNVITSPVNVSTRGGQLSISWSGDNNPVMMTGPAVNVFEGEIELI